MSDGLRKTPLDAVHRELGARMVAFAGWTLPLHYGSQVEEHRRVRADAGMFDVSHMRALDVSGKDAARLLAMLLANDAGKLAAGAALYSCMLDDEGGVLDDLIVYHLRPAVYRLVVNAATAEKDGAWIEGQRAAHGFDCRVTPRVDLAMIAVQGPQARTKCAAARPEAAAASALARFHAAGDETLLVARTGYTGEDGYEIMLPADLAEAWWHALLAAGVMPAGLGARDTLRLEAGLNLYGADMDESVTPLESGLAWTVDLKGTRDFLGRRALQRRAPRFHRLGLLLREPGVMRAHQRVDTPHGEGIVTSGGYGPTLDASIGLARLPLAVHPGDEVAVQIRGRGLRARVVEPPFVREGRVLVAA